MSYTPLSRNVAIAFVLNGLNTNITPTVDLSSTLFSTDVSGQGLVAQLDVSANEFTNVFQFGLPLIDLSENVDVSYNVSNMIFVTKALNQGSKPWLGSGVGSINSTFATLTPAQWDVSMSDTVPEDYIKYIADATYKTYLAEVLFTNTGDVVENISFLQAAALEGLVTQAVEGSNGNEYFSGNTLSPVNFALHLFAFISKYDPSMLQDLTVNQHSLGAFTCADTGTTYDMYAIPIIPGDSLTMSLTLTPDANQSHLLTYPGQIPIQYQPRTYNIILNMR